MSDTTLHTVLINRMWSQVLHDYAKMKNIKNITIKRNDHDELKEYESIYHRKLTRRDAIVISTMTENEINEVINGYYENEELLAFQKKISDEELEEYYHNYGRDI